MQQLRIRWFLLVVIVEGCLMLVDPRLSEAQIRPINQEEAKVPAYDVPDCLVQANGKRVAAIGDWDAHRRYLIATLANQEYGLAPSDTVKLEVTELERGKTPSQQSERRQLRMRLSRNDQAVDVDVVVYLPPKIAKPVPCFLALNFRGNHAMSDDPAVRLPSSWLPDGDGVVEHRATEAGRNLAAHRWPIDLITSRGYGLVSAYYGDLDPDFDDQFQNGVHALFPEWKSDDAHPHRWGSIAAWAWGLSRMADGLVEQPGVDPNGLMVVGHSRLGKTALWAGVTDPRFQIAFSNNSGCGGAALSKRIFGESIARINTSFPHWFCREFRRYNDREEQLEFDQHWLIAAMAPRSVYIASASDDAWADPLGEYLSGHHATAAFALHGLQGLPDPTPPLAGKRVGGAIGFHLRDGKHDLTNEDWGHFLDYADQQRSSFHVVHP